MTDAYNNSYLSFIYYADIKHLDLCSTNLKIWIFKISDVYEAYDSTYAH